MRLMMSSPAHRLTHESPGNRPERYLRELARRVAVVEMHLFDAEGVPSTAGKCQVQQFDEANGLLTVDQPTCQGVPLAVVPDTLVRVLFSMSGALWRFDTLVRGRRLIRNEHGVTITLLDLASPSHVESGNRRRSFRVEPLCHSRAVVRWRPTLTDPALENRLPWLNAELQDLSSQGVGVRVPKVIAERLKIGFRLDLALQLPTESGPIILSTRIRRICTETLDTDRPLVGLEFDFSGNERLADRLSNYIANCQREIARNRKNV